MTEDEKVAIRLRLVNLADRAKNVNAFDAELDAIRELMYLDRFVTEGPK